MPACPNCGEHNPDRFRFCGSCGSPLRSDPVASREVRKVVTVLFADVTGSTSLGERLDPESLRRVMTRYFEEMRAAVERHGGAVEKFIGDAVMAVFGIPQLHEDDALRAVRAAVEMRAALADLNQELMEEWGVTIEIRTGVNTGEVVVGEGSRDDSTIIGDAVNVAARLEQVASPGEILVGASTYRLVRDAARVEPVQPLALKGKGEPVPAFRLVDVVAGSLGGTPRMDSPLVGRGDESDMLRRAFERTIRQRSCHLFTVLGAAGVGKSRLVAELASSLQDAALVLEGRCLPYGEAVAFWPMVEVIREATGASEASGASGMEEALSVLLEGEDDAALIAQRLLQVLGLSRGAAAPEELFWAVRKLFEVLAKRGALVVVLDDLHWADPAFLDLVEHVADWSLDSPILLVCVARPDLLERRPSWAGGKLNAATVLLEPLSEQECDLLLTNLLGGAALEDLARRRITDAAEGNPLFLEETLAMLLDEGLLEREDGRWVPAGDLAAVSVPATIQALLSARLDALERKERLVIERASVAGKAFTREAVQHLTPEDAQAEVPAHLVTLVRKELIRPDHSGAPGEEAFRFRHILIRDAAYQALPKEVRAQLHERFAAWLEQDAREHARDYDEVVGQHLERAFRYRVELGPRGWRDRALALRAAERLGSGGRKAFARGDMATAADLLSRAVSLLPETDRARAALLPDLAEALTEKGELGPAEASVRDAVEEAAASGDPVLQANALVVRLLFEQDTGKTEEGATIRDEACRAIETFEQAGDERGLARAWRLVAETHWTECRYAAADEALQQAIEHARLAGEQREEAENLAVFALSAMLGPTPVSDAIRRCETILEAAHGNLTVTARVFRSLAASKASQGNFDEARELVGRSRGLLEDLGSTLRAAFVRETAGFVEMLAGEPAAAERELRLGYEALESVGATPYISTMAALLAQALWALGRDEEAEQLTKVSEQMAAAEDVISQVTWRSARAKVLARRAEPGAHELGAEAVRLAGETDRLDMHGSALLDLAEVLRLGGRHADAIPHVEEALRLYERKENVVSARRARETLEELAGAATAASG